MEDGFDRTVFKLQHLVNFLGYEVWWDSNQDHFDLHYDWEFPLGIVGWNSREDAIENLRRVECGNYVTYPTKYRIMELHLTYNVVPVIE